MNNKQFFNNLSATYADIRKLDVKKINLKGKNILEYIKEAIPIIKHANDTRETITENDLWGQWVETEADGTIIIHDDWITNPNSFTSWNYSITKVENNKAYVGDDLFANIQIEKIKDGRSFFYMNNALTSFVGNLENLEIGGGVDYISDGMFRSCLNLKTFTSELNSLKYGQFMFGSCVNLGTFNSDLRSLTDGSQMFRNCTNLESFTSDLPRLSNGYRMFEDCDKLTSFNSDLSSLIDGQFMFYYCDKLTSFYSALPSLTDGSSMFYGTKLASFSSDMPSLTKAESMFSYCSNLESFSSDLSSLIVGSGMFHVCNNFTSFTSELPNLVDGHYMFYGSSLDAQSVMLIIQSIKDIASEKQLYTNGTIPYVTEDRTSYPYKYSAPKGFMINGNYVYTYNKPNPHTTSISNTYVGKLTLGINVTPNPSTIKQQLEDFAKEATFDSWSDLKTNFSKKGWTVTFHYRAGGQTIPDTYDLRDGEQIIPCPIFAKLIEADEDSAQYCTEDASSFYIIEWGHDVTDTTGYTQFDSIEDAMASWNVFPKENIITTEEEA